ncbi:MAG: topoisomerase [Sphingomonadales bacterium]|jgi:DNA topoisomerase-1|nr:topoisomerase [Sphingomonadales bacterium]
MTGALHYVDDQSPGITRRRRGRYWQYFDARGKRVTDRGEIDRLNAIGLPPAYRDAWFCPNPNGHIQAIGYDDKGRKQYRYHEGFRERQEAAKYDRCAGFGKALPRLRRRVETDLAKRTLSRDTVVAAIVRLLDVGRIRVGNEAYAQVNKSYGATTLRNRHAKVLGRTVKMRFKAKSGVERELSITDARLSRIVRRCQDLPGQNLFQYVNGDGEAHPVSSTDVNDYIREATGEDFTAKHFRTWSASVIAFEQICAAGADGLGLNALLEPVAEALGNTPAISRKSYVHPALIDAVKEAKGSFGLQCPRATKYLSGPERGLIAFLGRKRTRKAAASR